MTVPDSAEVSIKQFLDALRTSGGLLFDYQVRRRPGVADGQVDAEEATEGGIEVTLSGPDTPMLLERNGELLHAMESLAAAILRLTPEQGEQVSFDAEGFKASRVAAIEQTAAAGVATVRSTGKPYLFAPMNSRERRMLHLALVPSGLATASSGLGPRRFVVLYPAGQTPDPERFEQPSRRPGPFRNQGGYRQQGGGSSGQGGRPQRGGGSVPPAERPVPQGGDEDNAGNLRENNAETPDSKEAVDARLDSIRRAFRKR